MQSSSSINGVRSPEACHTLMTRHVLAEQMAQTVDPHFTLAFSLLSSSEATVSALSGSDSPTALVVFATTEELTAAAADSGSAAIFAPLQPLAHLFPSPPQLPPLAAEELLRVAGSTHTVYCDRKAGGVFEQLLVVPLGPERRVTDDSHRNATWSAITRLKEKGVSHAALLVPPTRVHRSLDVITRIAVLSSHRFSKYLTQPPQLSSLLLLHSSLLPTPELLPIVRTASTIAEGTVFAREIACDRADTWTPSYLQRVAEMVAATSSLHIVVVDEQQLREQGLFLLASVGQGSREGERARLICLEYRGDPAHSDRKVALCGKGITFDTGGLHLKSTEGINLMHLDKSGAAVCLATVKALAALQARVNVVCVLAVAENMIGPQAQKARACMNAVTAQHSPRSCFLTPSSPACPVRQPLTIWPTVKGSVEITNTDCEGRLALVDAFSYVQRVHGVQTVIDCATLTLGVWDICSDVMSAAFSNDDRLWQQFDAAGSRVSERLWRFPVWPEHTEQLRNTDGHSDWKNHVGKVRDAAACTGIVWLQPLTSRSALCVDAGGRVVHGGRLPAAVH